MAIARRHLLHYSGAACALALLSPASGAAATRLRQYRVQDAVAQPRFAAGDVLTVDADITSFDGAGLYLYPAWGTPRLYEVHAAGAQLEFRNPGSGRLLWQQSAGIDSAFAGRVLDTAAAPGPVGFPLLSVPTRPARP